MPKTAQVNINQANLAEFTRIAAQARSAKKNNFHVDKHGALVFGRRSWSVRAANSLRKLFTGKDALQERNRAAIEQFQTSVREATNVSDANKALLSARKTTRLDTEKGHLTVAFIQEAIKQLNNQKLETLANAEEARGKNIPDFEARFDQAAQKITSSCEGDFPNIKEHLANNKDNVQKAFTQAVKIASNDNLTPLTWEQMQAIEQKMIYSLANPSVTLPSDVAQHLNSLPASSRHALDSYGVGFARDLSAIATHNLTGIEQYLPDGQNFDMMLTQFKKRYPTVEDKIPQWRAIIQDNHQQIKDNVRALAMRDADSTKGALWNDKDAKQKAMVQQTLINLTNGTFGSGVSLPMAWNFDRVIKQDMQHLDKSLPDGAEFKAAANAYISRNHAVTDDLAQDKIAFMTHNKDAIRHAIDKLMAYKLATYGSMPLTEHQQKDIRDWVMRYGVSVHGHSRSLNVDAYRFEQPASLPKDMRDAFHNAMDEIQWKRPAKVKRG